MANRNMNPKPSKREHGTRAMYVAEKCRCDKCRESNRLYYHSRKNRALKLAAKTVNEEKFGAPQKWTTPDGERLVRVYKRACPGLTKKGCPTHSHLRKDSKNGICGNCREHILTTHAYHSAKDSRDHLNMLSAAGVGVGAVMAKTGLSKATLQELRKGKKWVLPETERKILMVKTSDMAGGVMVDARATWRLIREMKVRFHIPKSEISKEIGNNGRSLQLSKKFVRLSTAQAIKRFYNVAAAGHAISLLCIECGLSHEKFHRLERLLALLTKGPLQMMEIHEKWPCVYPLRQYRKGFEGSRTIPRDLHEIGAMRVGLEWQLPPLPRDKEMSEKPSLASPTSVEASP
jgi:hypothetical protein